MRSAALVFKLMMAVLWLLALPGAHASTGGSYESGRLARVLARERLAVEPEPDGHKIAFIRIVRRDVFAADDPWPVALNALHWLTRVSVVQRELLFAEGETYEPRTVEETARILRGLGIFSLVRVVPVRAAERAGEMGILVFTRDLWSLRFEQAFQITGGTIDTLMLQLVERNLFGRNKRASVRYHLFPLNFAVGQVYNDRRVLGGSLKLFESFDVRFKRETGAPEGVVGSMEFGRPLYDLNQRWGWSLITDFDARVARRAQAATILTYDIPETDEIETIPRVWDQRYFYAQLAGSHQRGDLLKHRFSVGFGVSQLSTGISDEAGLQPGQRAPFERDVLPAERMALFPLVTYSAFDSTYVTFENLASFGRDEDVRMGPRWSIGLSLPTRALGSTTDSLGVLTRAGFVAAPGGGLIDLEISAEGRVEEARTVDQKLSLKVRGATPQWSFGRLVGRVVWDGRRNEVNNSLVTLGGDNGLRGFPIEHVHGFGANLIRANLELRTPPWVWRSVHVGAVIFYDVGAVYGPSDPGEMSSGLGRAHHAAGVGLRFLLPQLNTYAYRGDLGFPLSEGGFSALTNYGGGQAVPLTPREDDLIESANSIR